MEGVYLAKQEKSKKNTSPGKLTYTRPKAFVGREEELVLLKEELNKLGNFPHKPVIIISGEAGIGRTRLLEEVRTILKNEVFIKAECQKEEEEPYTCFNKIINSLIDLIEENYKEFIKGYGDILVSLSPGLRNKRYLRTVEPLKEIEKYYIFERFLQFIINLPIEKSIVIALEDFQYIRKESIEFLKYLTLSMPITSNIIFIITYREEEKPDDLIEFEKAIEGYLIKILLERLNIQSTRKFITSMIGEIEENELEYISDKIFKKTAGVPLFIEHLVKLLIEEKALAKEEDTWIINEDKLSGIELTGTCLQIIQEKLEKIHNKKLMRVVQYASIMGGEYIDSVILNEIMDKDIRRELKVLNNQWILRKEPIEGKERFKFAHPMIKEVAYQMIPQDKKKESHRKVGFVLEKHLPEEKAMLAYHFSLAGVKDKAYKYSLAAGVNAERNFAYLDTISLYETALRFAPTGVKNAKIRVRLARLYRITRNFEKGVKHLNEVISQKKDRELKVKAMVELMEIKRLQGENDEAVKLGENALKLIGKGVSKAKAEVYIIFGKIFVLQNEYSKALNYLNKALLIGDKLEDKELQAETRTIIGVTYGRWGEFNIAIKHLKEALELAERKDTKAKIYINLGFVYHGMEDIEKSDFYTQKSIELSRKIGNIRRLGIAYNNLASTHQIRGRSNDALKYYRLSLEYAKRIAYKVFLPLVYSNIGRVYAQINKSDLAIEYCNKALELLENESHREPWIVFNVYRNAGDIYFLCEDFDTAILYLKKSMELGKELNNLPELSKVRLLLSDIYADKGNLDEAEDLLSKVEEYERDNKNTTLLGLSYRTRSKIIKKDSPQEAMRYLENSLDAFGNPLLETEKVQTLYEMGILYLKMDEYQDALDVLLQAKEIQQEREEAYWLEKIEKSIGEVEELLPVLPKQVSLEIGVLLPIVRLISSKISLDRFIEEALTLVRSTLQIGQTAIIFFEDGEIQRVYSNEEIDEKTQRDITLTGKSVYQKKELVLKQKGLTLCIPIEVESRIKGAFYMQKKLSQFEPEVIEFLKLLSSIFWIGIEHIKLREEFPTKSLQGKKAILHFGNIVGESKAMQKIYNLIKNCAESDVTVLLEGETGVGKELVASAIHSYSRRKGSFVPIYCGGMPHSLFEGEFFGYKKGAFTGAIHDKLGLLEEANGGTIFFDEITSIPLSIQGKLLRVLQDGKFRRLGETKLKKVDARIISATNQDIEKLIARGEFRKDLFYRITTMRMKIPTLRERKDDIPLSVNHFLEKFNKRFGKNMKGFTEEAMQALINYRWEGNVRELEHEIERLVAMSKKESITIDDLKEEIRETKLTKNKSIVRLDKFMKNREREYILRALEQCNFNAPEAAKLLRIGRATLYRKLKEFKEQE